MIIGHIQQIYTNKEKILADSIKKDFKWTKKKDNYIFAYFIKRLVFIMKVSFWGLFKTNF